MISLAPRGELVALCREGRLLISDTGSRHEQPSARDTVVLAFDDQAWVVAADGDDAHLTRITAAGRELGHHVIRGAGRPRFARAHLKGHAAVLGFEARTLNVQLHGGELSVTDLRQHADSVVAGRNLIFVYEGVATSETGNRAISRKDLRVHDAWPLLGGSAVVFVGEDRRGPALDVIGLTPGGMSLRLRLEPSVLVAVSAHGPHLLFANGPDLTLHDVMRRSSIARLTLEANVEGVSIDALGEWVAVETKNGGHIIGLGRPRVSASEVRAETAARARSTAPEEPAFVRDGAAAGEIVCRSPVRPAEIIARYPYGDGDVPRAVEAAAKVAARWGDVSLDKRVAGLRRLGDELEARRDEIVACLMRESGRPQWESDREARGLPLRLEHTIATARAVLEERSDEVAGGAVRSMPLGVVAVIGPAMFPLATSHQHIVAALAAGNTVVWKPSPLATAAAAIYAEALRGADFPPGVVSVVAGPDATGAALAAHPAVDAVVFTGSARHGHELVRANVERIAQRQILHLGAKNPAIVLDDATLELAAYEVVAGAFASAGQRCTALSRAYVQRGILDEFAEAVCKVRDSLQIGSPTERVFLGPILSEERLRAFEQVLDEAPTQGAAAIRRGRRLDREGYFVEPSIHMITQTRADAPYQCDEHFAPDLAIHPVDDLDEAIARSNASPYGLCASLFTEDGRLWDRFAREMHVGAVLHNLGTHALSGRLPGGGVKLSGRGGRAGSDALFALRRVLSVQERHSSNVSLLPGTRPPND